MEDIKILEEFIQTNIDFLQVNKREIQAIENLIARNKELEEEKNFYKEWYEFYLTEKSEINKQIKEILNLDKCVEPLDGLKKIKNEFVSKSKVKEKFQNKRNQIFSCTYVDEKQWQPFDKALDIINDLEKELLD